MSTTTPTVNRRDITVTEEREVDAPSYLHPTSFTILTTWTADLNGPISTGEYVHLNRTGTTFTSALAALEAAIAEIGWSIK